MIEEQNKRIRLLYDAGMISNAMSKTCKRSGVFFVAYNLFKEFLKRDDVELELYCDYKSCFPLQEFVNEFYPELENKIYTNGIKVFTKPYYVLRTKKEKAKEDGLKLHKFVYVVLLCILSVIIKITLIFKKCRIENVNAYLSPYREIPNKISKINSIKKYLILHDAIPLIISGSFPKKCWQTYVYASINPNDYYFAVSENTRKDFIKYCPQIDENKIYTTLLACDEKFKHEPMEKIAKSKEKYGIPVDKKYVFSLCTLEPRKNLIRAVKTFIEFIKKNNIEDMYFVLGGGQWEKFMSQLEMEIDNLGDYKNKIIKAGYIDDEDLPALYSGAEWFVYTSQYEGFGLPPLEAMSCGTPVITSNNSSLPEVVGDAGIMIDWDSDEQHIEAYEKYYFNPELREENRQKGLERAKQFSWEKCANQIIEIIKENVAINYDK